MAYKINKTLMKKAIEECNGTMVDLGRKLGIPNGNTAKRWLNKYPDLVPKFEEKAREIVDIAEDTLIYCLRCESDAVRSSTAQFVLKTVGREKWGETSQDSQVKLIDLVDKLIQNAQS